ncbi:aldose 1-epimerase [Trinickia dabaoshanensis]|uniref:Aldose 1-epimerase n=1 Tax=Trinickia dabaoshanensis TaxID=564714 RepID=A0A2N7W1D0_9BURK|nr:aldose 1-epimerase [Trinickia dabaoshanensis]PMS23226.1 aldose 1-epimerase [Trinickia dabaoshanensis]
MSAANTDAIATRGARASDTRGSRADARNAKLAAIVQPVRPGPGTSAIARGAAEGARSAELTLANDQLRVGLAPSHGGGMTRFDWHGDGNTPTPIFRVSDRARGEADPNALACYPLVPFSNRIGGSRFHFEGREVAVPRNRADERLPIHGDGWLRAWRVAERGDTHATLVLERERAKPYAYRATLRYALDAATLNVTLAVQNAGREPLPFGLGLHPFLARDDDTRLAAAAGGLWLSGDDWLPKRHVPAPPAWVFGVAYPLPDALVNHAFTQWSGRASVVWPRRRLSLTIEADADYYVLYTPPGEDFFCFEPVDHPINAVNLPGGACEHGMTVLAPGERLERAFRFTVEPVGR